jgi:hypothetical protein
MRQRLVVRWVLRATVALTALLLAAPAGASTLSDFQARLAQTVWSIQQSEAILRTLAPSAVPVGVPDGLASYASLVSENVAALTAAATVRDPSDADRKAMADGLLAVALLLKDQSSLASNRGLATALAFGPAEQSCRSAVARRPDSAPARGRPEKRRPLRAEGPFETSSRSRGLRRQPACSMVATEMTFFSLSMVPLILTFLPAMELIFAIIASSPERTNTCLSSGL